ncbi:hypothetical protein ED733_006323 [Metarhizium rileyi]|uniref:FAD-binding domain-containing protein n=1 Tax=Metarhizium rileyi (strain RCEF 4871) TaxID=1649241 RepID=A0A5C6GMI5_METRR|nr:hypothetical protein ED733_006323 [Metarhizium rileyi]
MKRIFRTSLLSTSGRTTTYKITSAPSLSQSALQYSRQSSVRRLTTNAPENGLKYSPKAALQSAGVPLNVLIVGAGVAGPALANLLQRSDVNYNITVVERFPELRTAGQQIDLKTHGVKVLRKMDLLDSIKSHCVNETGLEVLDTSGKQIALFGVSPSSEQRPGLTSEYEIMRGDAVRVLYDASLEQNSRLKESAKDGRLTYEFGNSVTDLTQSDDSVHVTFSNGKRRQYDLVVAADGQGSRTRRLAFGQKTSDEAFKSVGIHGAYYSIPKSEGDGTLAKGVSAPGRRMIITRPSGRAVTQVLLYMKDSKQLAQIYKEPIEKQKEFFTVAYQGAGWETDRILSGMKTAKDFYAHELGQIKMKTLHTGRVVLLGDAGYCPTPFTGMGAAGCLVGAYILAGELARHPNNVTKALEMYEQTVQAPVDEFQTLRGPGLDFFFPSSHLGVWFLRNILWAASKLEQIISQRRSNQPVAEDKKPMKNGGWRLPVYPELNLD